MSRTKIKTPVAYASNVISAGSVNYARKTTKSVSKDNLLQFPLLVDKSVGSLSMSVLNKALEHEYSSYIILALSNMLVARVDGKSTTTASDILKQVHTNIDVEGLTLGTIGTMIKEEFDGAVDIEICSVNSTTVGSREFSRLNEESILYPLEFTFNNSVLNESKNDEASLKGNTFGNDTGNLMSAKYKSELRNRSMNHNNGSSIKKGNLEKQNVLAPTVITVGLKFKLEDIDEVIERELTFGIKTIIHGINTDEYIQALNSITRKPRALVSLVKWLTGEVTTLKTFFSLTGIEGAKRDVKNRNIGNKTSSRWWYKLSQMTGDDKTRSSIMTARGVRDTSKLTAVTTLVISKNTALQITNKFGNNIFEHPHVMKDIFRGLFIMGVVIVDDTADEVHIYDSDLNNVSTHSLASLRAFSKEEIKANADLSKSLFSR